VGYYPPVLRALIFLLFFLSGAAGLVYEVTWARSLGLVFGASHLAVTTVLAVYMGGQALGSSIFGGVADRSTHPLRLYGWLEIGIGASALGFLGLMKIYPWIYPPIARLGEGSGAYLTTVRAALAVAAMIVPTTLMGGTLPVLTRFIAREGDVVAHRLSALYTFNTFGAVAGTLAAGFLLIPSLGITRTLLVAVGVSTAVGLIAVLLQSWLDGAVTSRIETPARSQRGASVAGGEVSNATIRMILAGIAVSGFCALGYEVLWTRMLTLVIGTSVYSFTIMLVAFLAGIGAGSHAFLLVGRWAAGGRSAVRAFGVTQVLIGLSALVVTLLMGLLPSIANHLRSILEWKGSTEFAGRLLASFAVGSVFMFVPPFFMGLAFPLAGAVWSAGHGRVGSAVGRLLTANTIGAILGSVVSGFFLIRWFGIERSLQMLVLVNIGTGLAVIGAVSARRWVGGVALAGTVGLLVARAVVPSWGRVWDQKYFATYVNSGRSTDTPEMARRKFSDIEVLYFHEGVNETVSVTRSRGREQGFIVNGRPEASTAPMDLQLQKALGHLPMLLHPKPRSVFVLGTGTGMTLGATAVHPEVERLVLGEIEEGVLGVARTFSSWNGNVLENPKLQIVFNDGRNFLATTKEKFDVITADPIHPWSGGAGYLYTVEYFRSVADRLAPGGIAAQWLPLYELTEKDIRTVVRTFASSFKHSMLWLTHYDAVLVGSEEPIRIDEGELATRMSVPRIRDDLSVARMSTPDDLLSFFLFGTSGAHAFGRGGDLNTDDNVVLEFSAPSSQGVGGLDAKNVKALSGARETILPYLVPAPDDERKHQAEEWSRRLEAGRRFDDVHERFLLGEREGPAFDRMVAAVRDRASDYAPLRFLLDERKFWERTQPALVDAADFPVQSERGGTGVLRISVVRQYVGHGSVLVSVVDNARRQIYGQRYIDGEYDELDTEVARFASQTLRSFRQVAGGPVSPATEGLPREADLIAAFKVDAARRVGTILQAEGP